LALTSFPCVELPGIEPELLPGKMHSGLLFRYVSFPFSPARYLRFRFRVLTASRVVAHRASFPDRLPDDLFVMAPASGNNVIYHVLELIELLGDLPT
jgi:hypothetical protein